MKDALRNLLEMKPQNLDADVYISILVIWLMVLFATLWSIKSARLPGLLKFFWAVVVIAIPLVGVALYAVFSLTKLDYKLLNFRAKAAKAMHESRHKDRPNPPTTLSLLA